MTPKTRNIIGWVLAGLITAFMLFSATGKFMADPKMQQMMAGMGLTPGIAHLIGTVEIISALLFLIPRTGVAGTLLLAAYLGGAIATHVEHPQAGPPIAAIVLECLVWITAAIRFPELTARLMGRTPAAQA